MLAPPRSTASISVPRHEKFADRIDGAISILLFSSIRLYAVLSIVGVRRARGRAGRNRTSIVVLTRWSGFLLFSFTVVHIASRRRRRSVGVLNVRIGIAIGIGRWPVRIHIRVAILVRILVG